MTKQKEIPDPDTKMNIIRRYLHVLALLQNKKEMTVWNASKLADIITLDENRDMVISDKTIRDYIKKNLQKELELDIRSIRGGRKTELVAPIPNETLERLLHIYTSFIVDDDGRSIILRMLMKRHPNDCLWILGRLYFAIRDKNIIKFDYKIYELDTSSLVTFTVHPYRMVMRNLNLYLVAFNEYNLKVILLIVNKIENLEVQDSRYREDIPDINELFKDTLGSFIGESIYVKLRIHNSIRDKIDQIISILEPIYKRPGDEHYTAEFKVSDAVYLCKQLFQFGSSVEIIEPKELRNIMKEMLMDCMKIYK